MNRRRFLASAAVLAASSALAPWPARAQAKPLRFADMHSHLGILRRSSFTREAMTANGMQLIARKIVADLPVTRTISGKIQAVREAAPGELARHMDGWIARLHAQNREQQVAEIVSVETLDRAIAAGEPAAVIATEGGDGLEGDLKRLEAARAAGLVHLQIVHYRVSEIGDISSERPVYNGLSAFGKDVVSACNRLGILVDVAHGSSAVIDQVIELSTTPVIYSHGHVTSTEPYFTQNVIRARAIHKPLAMKIAGKGGMVGLWPIGSQFHSLEAYADALMGMADALGPAHVGIGTDMFGLPSTVIPDYAAYPELEEIFAKRRVSAEDSANILGRNYLRVLRQALAT